MEKYPCEVHVGDYLVMKDGRRWKVKEILGRYFITAEGNSFSRRHPDIEYVDQATEDELLEDAIREIHEEPIEEAPAPKPKRTRKKAAKKEE